MMERLQIQDFHAKESVNICVYSWLKLKTLLTGNLQLTEHSKWTYSDLNGMSDAILYLWEVNKMEWAFSSTHKSKWSRMHIWSHNYTADVEAALTNAQRGLNIDAAPPQTA